MSRKHTFTSSYILLLLLLHDVLCIECGRKRSGHKIPRSPSGIRSVFRNQCKRRGRRTVVYLSEEDTAWHFRLVSPPYWPAEFCTYDQHILTCWVIFQGNPMEFRQIRGGPKGTTRRSSRVGRLYL